MGQPSAAVHAEAAESLRRTMVERQLRTFDVVDLDVLSAFEAVPREDFVAPGFAAVAYSDRVLPCKDGKRALMSPMVLARMLQDADVTSTCAVLDVAGGAGYAAAVLRRLAARVVTIDSGDVTQGAAGQGPFDVIVVNGVIETRPDALLAQLAEGGRLVALERNGAAARAVRYDRRGDDCSKRTLFNASGPTVEEFRAAPGFVF